MMTDDAFIEWLDQYKIRTELSQENREKLYRLEIFDSIDSTNNYLLNLAKTNINSGWVCLAEEQTQGRGRQGKEWFSPKGKNIYCSMLWNFTGTKTDISHLSLAVAVMVVRALQKYGIVHGLQLKWPNDIYFNNRKLAGILIEGISSHPVHPVVIGIGINMQLPSPNPYAHNAIDIEEILTSKPERNKLVGLLINELLDQLPNYADFGFSVFLQEWNQWDLLKGKLVVISTPVGDVMGIEQGINEAGELFIRDEYGKVQSYRCGEVSARLLDQVK